MIDKKILISIVIVLLIGVTAASYQITTKTPGVWQPSISQVETQTADQGSSETPSSSSELVQTSQSQTSTSSGSSGQTSTDGSDVKISVSQAKIIAGKQVLDSSASPGTPDLITQDGKKVYNVPVLDKQGDSIGYFIIDAQTGKIIEGAGGAPSG